MAELNRQLAQSGEAALPINRFRANFVVAGAGPFEEDGWRTVRIGGGGSSGGADDDGVSFDSIKPCSRCKVGAAAGVQHALLVAALVQQRLPQLSPAGTASGMLGVLPQHSTAGNPADRLAACAAVIL